MSKKILIHSIVFSPDSVSTAYLYNDIALKFKDRGYTVVVLTTTPHYNVMPAALSKQPMKKKLMGLYYESDFKGIKVKHVPQKKYKQSVFRILGFVYWHLLSFFMSLFERKVDVILSPSPPLTIGLVNLMVAKLKGAKVIYNVQEIYPDFLIEQTGLKNKTIISLLKSLERFVYNHSDTVTTIDQVFFDTIVNRFDDKNKLKIIPNFVDTDLYKPLAQSEMVIDRKLFPVDPDRLKVMYAGNIGHAQDWKPLIDAAINLKAEPVSFYIIGEGVMKEYIFEQIELHQLTNVYLLPYQPREQMPSIIAYADLHFIFMSKEMEGHGFPSKVYTIMACAKPLIVCSGKNTPIYQFLSGLNCAYLISENESDHKLQQIIQAIKMTSKEELKLKGEAGLHVIKARYSSAVVTEQYVAEVDSLLQPT